MNLDLLRVLQPLKVAESCAIDGNDEFPVLANYKIVHLPFCLLYQVVPYLAQIPYR